MNAAIGHAAVKPRDHGAVHILEDSRKHLLGALAVKASIRLKQDKILGVQEGKAKVFRQNQAVQIFAPAGAIIPADVPLLDFVLQVLQNPGHIQAQAQVLHDSQKALPHRLEGGAILLALLPKLINAV